MQGVTKTDEFFKLSWRENGEWRRVSAMLPLTHTPKRGDKHDLVRKTDLGNGGAVSRPPVTCWAGWASAPWGAHVVSRLPLPPPVSRASAHALQCLTKDTKLYPADNTRRLVADSFIYHISNDPGVTIILLSPVSSLWACSLSVYTQGRNLPWMWRILTWSTPFRPYLKT